MSTAATRLSARQLSSCLLFAASVLAAGSTARGGESVYVPRNDPNKIQAILDELKSRLAIHEVVHVSIVPANPLMVSVESLREPQRAFLLSLEDSFLDQLTDSDLRAVIAHELGHVWIFTHHPYLQTEQLANQVAMRAVSRDSLERVYGKVWERTGTKGDLARFLGPVTVASSAHSR